MSSLSDEELEFYLQKIRRIASMDHDAAIAEVDELAGALALRTAPPDSSGDSEAAEEPDYELEDAQNEIVDLRVRLKNALRSAKRERLSHYELESIEDDLNDLGTNWSREVQSKLDEDLRSLREDSAPQIREGLKLLGQAHIATFRKEISDLERQGEKGQLHPWLISRLEQRAESVGEQWEDDRMKEALANEIDEVRREAEEVTARLLAKEHESYIRTCKDQTIRSITSARKILEELTYAEQSLSESGLLTSDLVREIRTQRERCAWHRANKKMSAAEVARDSGNEKKASRLIVEAQALLKQDWAEVFPSESCPEV